MSDPALLLEASNRKAVPLTVVAAADWPKLARSLPPDARAWAESNGFAAQAGRSLVVPGAKGGIARVLVGRPAADADPFTLGKLCRSLPEGSYALDGDHPDAELVALGWVLEGYSFDVYRKGSGTLARLVCPKGVDRAAVLRAARASYLARDLINTPSSDMGPDELEAAAREVASAFKAKLSVTKGRALEEGFPMIHAVGQASPRAPRLIDFSWGPANGPKVTLVGKGVCFDTGGLDIKPPSGMILMKKDMGGAANVLGLAHMIMDARLPVRLRVLIPAVENSISGNAFRPSDILHSRKGLTVEIGNTDAEGRLILGDALALADEDAPDLLVDLATLTGAARAALGPDLPPFYTDDEEMAAAIAKAAVAVNDPVWRMPFWQSYTRLFESSVADMNNAGESAFAGSITAALFLKRFVEKAKTYVHFDIYGWTPGPKPGRPKGGEAQAMRALFTIIKERYA